MRSAVRGTPLAAARRPIPSSTLQEPVGFRGPGPNRRRYRTRCVPPRGDDRHDPNRRRRLAIDRVGGHQWREPIRPGRRLTLWVSGTTHSHAMAGRAAARPRHDRRRGQPRGHRGQRPAIPRKPPPHPPVRARQRDGEGAFVPVGGSVRTTHPVVAVQGSRRRPFKLIPFSRDPVGKMGKFGPARLEDDDGMDGSDA